MYHLHLSGSSLAISYFILCLFWTTIAHFGLCAYFQSAYAATLGIWVSVSLWFECAGPQIIQKLLPSSEYYPWNEKIRSVKYVFMIIELFVFVLNALIVSALAFGQWNGNLDCIFTMCLYWISVSQIMLKFFIIYRRRRAVDRKFKLHNRSRSNAIIGEHLHSALECELARGKQLLLDANSRVIYRKQRNRDISQKFRYSVVMIFYFVFIFLLLGAFINQALLTHDHRTYPIGQYLHQIRQISWHPLSVYVRCIGHGNLSVIIENDIDRPALLSLEFLPKILHQTNKGIKICVYDRFGYGWSDPIRHDYIRSPTQSNDIHIIQSILPSLLNIGILSHPLVYIGYGYGALRVLDFVNSYPKLIDGVILIDPISFVQDSYKPNYRLIGSFSKLIQWMNAIPLGWTRLLWYLQNKNLDDLLTYNCGKNLPNSLSDEIYASLMRGNTFMAALHERLVWSENAPKNSDATLHKLIKSQKLVSTICPLLLLERCDLNKYQKNGSYLVQTLVNSTSTDEAAFSVNGVSEVAMYITQFLSSTFTANHNQHN